MTKNRLDCSVGILGYNYIACADVDKVDKSVRVIMIDVLKFLKRPKIHAAFDPCIFESSPPGNIPTLYAET